MWGCVRASMGSRSISTPAVWSTSRHFSRRAKEIASYTPQEKWKQIQKRKHKPLLPSSIRKRKRVLVLDAEEDIPTQIQRLKDAMFAGSDALSPAVLQNHWSTLMDFSYKHMFEQERRNIRPQTRQWKIAHLGMPPDRRQTMLMADSKKLKQLEECFSQLSKSFHANNVNYTQMITAYERTGQPEKAVVLFEKMKREGVLPDKFTFNAMIKTYGSLGNSAEAVHLLDDMEAMRLRPDVITYTNLINIFAKEQDTNGMLKAYDMMLKYNVRPTVITIATLVDGLSKASRMREAIAVFGDLASLGVAPNAFVFNAIIWGAARKGDIRQARQYLKEMAEAGVAPDMMTFKAMLNAFIVAGQYKDALDLHAAVLQGKFGNVEPSELIYNHLLNLWGNSPSPNVTTGLEMFKEAKRLGLFQKTFARDNDSVNLTPLFIGTVPFAVQTTLHSYIDRHYAHWAQGPQGGGPAVSGQEGQEGQESKTKLKPLQDVSRRGLVFLCGPDEPRRATTEFLIKRADPKLQHHIIQEEAMIRDRVEAELQFAEIKYNVVQTSPIMTTIVVPQMDIIHYAIRHLRLKKQVRQWSQDDEEYTYRGINIYKPIGPDYTAFDRYRKLIKAPRLTQQKKSKQTQEIEANRARNQQRREHHEAQSTKYHHKNYHYDESVAPWTK